MSINKLKSWIKRRDSWLSRGIYSTVVSIRYLRLPAPGILFKPLLWLHLFATRTVKNLLVFFYWKPLFLQYLDKKPKHLILEKTMPYILGKPKIILGEDCRINGDIVISAKTTNEYIPELSIGSRVGIQYQSQFYIGTNIIIGDDCRIAEGCILRGYSGHPLDPIRRKKGEAELATERGGIELEDNVWLGSGVKVNANVTIGKNSVIASGSIVTKDIPPGVLAGGIPAKPIRLLNQ